MLESYQYADRFFAHLWITKLNERNNARIVAYVNTLFTKEIMDVKLMWGRQAPLTFYDRYFPSNKGLKEFSTSEGSVKRGPGQ